MNENVSFKCKDSLSLIISDIYLVAMAVYVFYDKLSGATALSRAFGGAASVMEIVLLVCAVVLLLMVILSLPTFFNNRVYLYDDYFQHSFLFIPGIKIAYKSIVSCKEQRGWRRAYLGNVVVLAGDKRGCYINLKDPQAFIVAVNAKRGS